MARERPAVVIRRRRGQHVDRIADAGRGGQKRSQLGARRVAERGQLEPVRLAGIGGQDARTAGVGQDRDAARRAGPADATSSAATSNSSSSRSVRMTPACRNSASTTASLEASAPVCEAAARAPAVERPAFTATIGLRPRRRGARSRLNFFGLPKLSR